MRRLIPRLYYFHRNFFFIYLATAFFHLWLGMTQLFAPRRYTEAPQLDEVFRIVPVEVWGVASILIWVLMTWAAFAPVHKFYIGRIGLCIGLFAMVYRGTAVELDMNPAGVGAAIYFLIAVMHYTQIVEPQANPYTAKAKDKGTK